MLMVLTVGRDSGGDPAVTFQVDNVVYRDKHPGVVSTSWGNVTVIAIDADAKTVTLTVDSNTVTMTETQTLYE